MSKAKVGIVHPGQMGVVAAVTMRNSGHEVYWVADGRSVETCRRAADAGLTDAESIARLCETCSAIVSVCPPEFAEETAAAVARCGFRGLYVDANAIAPERARRIGRLLAQGGAQFLDACIMGLPTRTRGETWLYVSGEGAERAVPLFSGGPLEIEVLGDEVGQASSLKMCFAAHSKGTAALLAAVMSAAEVLGVRAALERQWSRSGPNVARATASVRQSAPKAWRYLAEMNEIAETFDSVGAPKGFPMAAKEVFERLVEFKGAAGPGLEEVLREVTRRR